MPIYFGDRESVGPTEHVKPAEPVRYWRLLLYPQGNRVVLDMAQWLSAAVDLPEHQTVLFGTRRHRPIQGPWCSTSFLSAHMPMRASSLFLEESRMAETSLAKLGLNPGDWLS